MLFLFTAEVNINLRIEAVAAEEINLPVIVLSAAASNASAFLLTLIRLRNALTYVYGYSADIVKGNLADNQNKRYKQNQY